jgi:hypothetical protein
MGTELLAKRSNKGNSVHKFGCLKISKLMGIMPDVNTAALQCNGMFILAGETEERTLKPAVFTLNIVKSNRVIGLDAQLLRLGVSGEGDRVPVEFLRPSMADDDAADADGGGVRKQCVLAIDVRFALSIRAVTENGSAFVPAEADPASFEAAVKFCPFEEPYSAVEEPFLPAGYEFRGRLVNSSSFLSRVNADAAAESQDLYFSHNRMDGFMQKGLYELTVSYVEKREGDQYQSKGKKKVMQYNVELIIMCVYLFNM